jgi:hypothetical protein
MDKVQKHSNSECYTQLSESFKFYLVHLVMPETQNISYTNYCSMDYAGKRILAHAIGESGHTCPMLSSWGNWLRTGA